MIVTADEIAKGTVGGFAKKHPHFREFQTGEACAPYWTLCVHALSDYVKKSIGAV